MFNKEKYFSLFFLMRPKQWIKNAFVFTPILFASELLNIHLVLQEIIAIMYFSIASSSTYIINDLQDIENDKKHPIKSQKRPLASGKVTIHEALFLLSILYIVVLSAYLVMPSVFFAIITYMVLNIFYTYYLKNEPVLDIFTIAAGFVIRVYAGALAIHSFISGWMFVTTLSLALFLASIKRKQELEHTGIETRAVLKKYTPALVNRFAEMSATGAIVFYSMFAMTVKPAMLYTIPLVLFGLYRYWYIVEYYKLGESPTDALLRDSQLIITIFLWLITCIYALYGYL